MAYVEFLFGTWWGGGAINPVNFRWSAKEVAYSLDDCDTRILLVDKFFAPQVAAIRPLSTSLKVVVYTGDGPAPEGMLRLRGPDGRGHADGRCLPGRRRPRRGDVHRRHHRHAQGRDAEPTRTCASTR